jgi:hypothetical protein
MLSLQSTRYNPVARIEDIVREIYGLNPQNIGRKTHHPAAVLWGIGNEFDQDPVKTPAANVAAGAKIVEDLEDAAGIPDSQKLVFTSPVSFAALRGRPRFNRSLSCNRLSLPLDLATFGTSAFWRAPRPPTMPSSWKTTSKIPSQPRVTFQKVRVCHCF